jgi:F-type H+-transporting ATPase subunit b
MFKKIGICIFVVCLALTAGVLFAQSSPEARTPAVSQSVAQPAAQPAENASERDSGKASAKAGDSKAPAEEEEENIQFKYSAGVRKVASLTGLSKETVYWIFLTINFLILVAGLVWIVRKAMPKGFAPRAAEIKKGIEDARKASAEASARLGEIEGRLAKLDTEITEIRTAAEADFSIEEQRIKAAAEQDAKNVIALAEQEIAAAARTAQRELKAFAADLAVDLAEKKIKVDDAADRDLVRGFTAQLGKDGH